MPEVSFEESQFLYAVYNLDSVQNPKANKVPPDSMRKGLGGVISLLELFPPRLIVPMEQLCFDLLKEGLRVRGYDLGEDSAHEFNIQVPINKGGRYHREGFGFKIKGYRPLAGTVVINLFQHPARIFRRDYAEACAQELRRLFEALL